MAVQHRMPILYCLILGAVLSVAMPSAQATLFPIVRNPTYCARPVIHDAQPYGHGVPPER